MTELAPPSIEPGTIAYGIAYGIANARQMVLNRDQRFDTLEELAASYSQALPTSVADRQALHEAIDALTARVTALEQLRLRGSTGRATITSIAALGGTKTATVPLTTAMPDGNYLPLPFVDASTGINLGALSLTAAVKDPGNVTVTVKNNAVSMLSSVTVQVVAIELA